MTDNTYEVPADNEPTAPLENSSKKEVENLEAHNLVRDLEERRQKKPWKSYLWEFLMLFLAVLCGFIAQWQLENMLERGQEDEFIKSMVEDAQIDISNIERISKKNKNYMLSVDSLAIACFNYETGKSNDFEIYRLFRRALSSLESLKPTERTLLQLNNGGMRLIRNKASTDNMIFYDGFAKEVKGQQEIVYKLKYEFVNASFELFNYKYFNLGVHGGVSSDAKLLNHDTIKLTQFANRISVYGGVLTKYNFDLKEMNKNAVELINILQKEYHLRDK